MPAVRYMEEGTADRKRRRRRRRRREAWVGGGKMERI